MVWAAVIAELCAAAGVAAVIAGIARKGLPGSTRLLYILFGGLVALFCGSVGVVWFYLASCEPSCL